MKLHVKALTRVAEEKPSTEILFTRGTIIKNNPKLFTIGSINYHVADL